MIGVLGKAKWLYYSGIGFIYVLILTEWGFLLLINDWLTTFCCWIFCKISARISLGNLIKSSYEKPWVCNAAIIC